MAKLEKDVPLRVLLKDVPLRILLVLAIGFGPSLIVDFLNIETFKETLIVHLTIPLVIAFAIIAAYLIKKKFSK